jgi:hypothetical protein
MGWLDAIGLGGSSNVDNAPDISSFQADIAKLDGDGLVDKLGELIGSDDFKKKDPTATAEAQAVATALEQKVPGALGRLSQFSEDQLQAVKTLPKGKLTQLIALPDDQFKKIVALPPQRIAGALKSNGWTPAAGDPANDVSWQQQGDDKRAGAKDPKAPATPPKAGDKDDKDKKAGDDLEKKAEEARKRTEAQEKAKEFVEHVRLCNKAQQDALLSAIHMMI